jgi:L-histidine N-alpha-methyltransferase
MVTAFLPRSDEPRFALLRAETPRDDFARDVREGLTAMPKTLPPRWFYDELGSSLFDAICDLPEYYVTRAESEILTAHAAPIVASFGESFRLIELGSGSARKTRILLDAIAEPSRVEYVPVDVDATMLEKSGRALLADYPGLRVTAIHADFARPSLALAPLPPTTTRTVVLFLGSTIGNLDPIAAVAMLRDLRASLRTGDALFLGADLRKSASILEPAYDDALGVTAAFNLNVLMRINRELGGHFEPRAFAHHAFFNDAASRIEMHLVSRESQRVTIDALGLTVSFDRGETIHTESSYKYAPETLAALARESGFAMERTWIDAAGWFVDGLMVGV